MVLVELVVLVSLNVIVYLVNLVYLANKLNVIFYGFFYLLLQDVFVGGMTAAALARAYLHAGEGHEGLVAEGG